MTLGTFIWIVFGVSIVIISLGLSLKLPENGLGRFIVTFLKTLLLIVGIVVFIMMGYAILQHYIL